MSFEVIATDNFKKEAKPLAKKYHSFKDDIKKLLILLEDNPKQGLPLGKDCYKIRMAINSKGKGKSGGSRVGYMRKKYSEISFSSFHLRQIK